MRNLYHISLLTWFFIASTFLYSGIIVAQPQGYYDNAEGLSGATLKAALHQIIRNHQARTYSQLWQDFYQTDAKANGKVWDMYSDVPGGTPAYEYSFFTDQCGNYTGEGQCYNREHSWPSSWFNGQPPMYTDLFHVVPTDGYVNNKRGNFPFGEVGQTSWTSSNGSKLGQSITQGYSGVVFEPIDAYKGDFARGILYMSVRYFTEDGNWPGSDMTDGANLLPWASALMLKWHQDDPVSQKELDRNEAIYAIQLNRNPFIDRPDFAELIWGEAAATAALTKADNQLKLWPNPLNSNIVSIDCFSCKPQAYVVSITDISGKKVLQQQIIIENNTSTLSVESLPAGFYLLQLSADHFQTHNTKLIRN